MGGRRRGQTGEEEWTGGEAASGRGVGEIGWLWRLITRASRSRSRSDFSLVFDGFWDRFPLSMDRTSGRRGRLAPRWRGFSFSWGWMDGWGRPHVKKRGGRGGGICRARTGRWWCSAFAQAGAPPTTTSTGGEQRTHTFVAGEGPSVTYAHSDRAFPEKLWEQKKKNLCRSYPLWRAHYLRYKKW